MTTTSATNQAAYQRLHDATNRRDLELISRTVDEVFHPDAVFHVRGPVGATAPEAVKGAWAMLRRVFPDIQVTIEDTITEGDKIVFRTTVTGTHQGEYRGLAATGKTITYDEMFIIRFSEGRVAEVWGIVDVFSQLQQLGVQIP
ncbi:ester cyclase [Glycomyces tenuis]|uniref:ester cyclase n=1 Tax=Glycomyces tenuis TaxID=58116 RepID=UPI000412D33E|nr:ester cyclase [Glycomyces tenuis]